MSSNGPVAIIGALEGEISAFLDYFDIVGKQKWMGYTFYPGKINGKDVVIVKSGVGKVLTSMITQKLIDLFSPSSVIFTGIAGSLNKNFELGDIVIGKDSVQHDVDASHFKFKRGEVPYTHYRFFESDAGLYAAAKTFKSEKYKVYSGRILTGDQFIVNSQSEKTSYLIDELNGDCVEMEGAAMAQVCIVNQIPHLIIRTISDHADGKIKINLRDFLEIASMNSLNIIKHMLNKL